MARSLKKGPFVFDILLKKVQDLNKSNKIPEKHLNKDSFCLDHYSENQIKINQISGININSEKNCNNELINNNKRNKLK